ncbi:mediator of RNA polymerase II transcription subunit 12-like protein isoform X4 [Dermacentor variabilis]|uniref:mediator of RNA polymerase II transcription subunit 12-like protein isoform X4 n=1 Tax=Dermacentor variabilis TaxID=34621 RepID=UPI003F5C4D1B
MMAAPSWLFEKRHLKKPRLGPPDVYPQDPKQKEDELTAINVKQGFITNPQINDEYGSARNANITSAKFGAFFSAILSKKQELNTIQDSSRKKQQINTKEHFWPVTARSKNAIEAWFRDLAGSKPLTNLAKKVPIFNKKEEIFLTLFEFSVPMLRAAWFIKMTSVYHVAISEAKMKKRQLPDPCQEWTASLCKFLRELLHKLVEHSHPTGPPPPPPGGGGTTPGGPGSGGGASPGPPAATPAAPSIPPDTTIAKQWHYCTNLASHLYEEGLLDHQDFLNWILELVEKTKSPDDPILKLVMPLTLQYVGEFSRSELLSRRLAHHCSKKLSQLVADYTVSSPRSQSPVTLTANSTTNGGNTVSPVPNPPSISPLAASFAECLSCSHHRSIVLQLSVVLQYITLKCPTALVWNSIGEGKANPILNGSPLDLLPCPPSCLPMPPRPFNAQVRQELRRVEQQVIQRGRAAEMHWSCDKWQQMAAGTTITRVLGVLDALDRHSFDRVDATNSLDTLYSKVFAKSGDPPQPVASAPGASPGHGVGAGGGGSNAEGAGPQLSTPPPQDEPIVRLLCEWAVTTKRSGEHRALVVARLLEKRQNELNIEKYNDADLVDEKDSQDSGMAPTGLPIFQNLLVNFLDMEAPVLDDKPSPENRTAFANLVLLFAELIHCDVFSHDAYMCTLISRGYFASHPPGGAGLPSVMGTGTGSISGAPRAPSPEPSLTGFLDPNLGPSPSHGSASNPGNASGMSMGLGLGDLGIGSLGEPSRQADSLHMFEPGAVKHEVGWGVQMDMDDAGLDADLDNILQRIKEGQQNMSDQPDSVGSDKEEGGSLQGPTTPLAETPGGGGAGIGCQPGSGASGGGGAPVSGVRSPNWPLRHLQYTTHFPLPQEEGGLWSHDCNQRHILLYGVGKIRDEARHALKKVTKELQKLFAKKASMDIADGGKVKRHAREGFNFEAVTARFQSLSYFDQHVVALTCAASVVEMLAGFAAGSSNHLPLVDYIAFLFDLMELSFNIHGLIEFGLQLLKELVEVENQLVQKNSALSGTYATSLGLYIVGLFYRYHCCLLVCQDYTLQACESLCKLVKNVANPAECTSAERCVLCYLHDLYSSCSYLKSKHSEIFGSFYSKVKQTLYAPQTPSSLNLLWNSSYMIECVNNPRIRVDPQQIKQLSENSAYRYSFVCNAVQSISVAQDADRLNDISLLCAELTASCGLLSAEWLGVLKALCCSSNHACGFIDVLTQVDVGDLSIHDNLAVFTCILVARRCFSLQDFVVHVAIPSLLSASPVGGAADQDAESGARLTCHLLLRLFRTVDSMPPAGSAIPLPRPLFLIRSLCDRHLLSAAHSSMRVEPVLAVLKAILLLGDASTPALEAKAKLDSNQGKGEPSINDLLGPIDDTDFDLSVPPSLGRHPSSVGAPRGTGIESAGLNDFAKYALGQICSQQWIHERCLRDPDVLCSPDLLLDPMLSHKQAETLLHMICHPKGGSSGSTNSWISPGATNNGADTFGAIVGNSACGSSSSSSGSGANGGSAGGGSSPHEREPCDQRQLVSRVLLGLDQWSMRVSWLELQLRYKQCASPAEVNAWLDSVARATIDVFQLTSEESPLPLSARSAGADPASPVPFSRLSGNGGGTYGRQENDRIWFVAPLIAKLPAAVQGKVLRAAGQVLESGSWACIASSSSSKSKDKDKQVQRSASLLSHQPFLSLVLMCLKGQDEQREGLLNSLQSQLTQCVHISKDEKPIAEDLKSRLLLHEALLLRLSLVGGMFDMIQRNTSFTTDWALLLVQLISHGVVDLHCNFELFTTVLDMLAALIHTTQNADSVSGEETRKQYLNLVKKMKKEVSDMDTESMKMVHQLLPLTKQQCEVIACEPMGSLIDTKGNKIAGFDSIDKKQGLQVAEKQCVSPWDLLEGQRNPAPLSWMWFGAVRMERKPRLEEMPRGSLLWHTHSALAKPASYFLEQPPLPPEELLEPPAPLPAAPSTAGVGGPHLGPPPHLVPPPHLAPPHHLVPHLAPPHIGQPPDKHLQMQLLEDPKRALHEIHSAPSPRGGAKKPKAQRRPRKAKGLAGQAPPVRGSLAYPPEQQPMYPQGPPPPPQQWYGQQPPPMQQQSYYAPQQPLPPGGPRFERQLSQSKAALSSMLRARHPSAQFLGGPPQGTPQGPQGAPAVTMQGPVGGPGSSGAPPYAQPNMDMLQKQQQQRHQMMMRQQQMRPQGMAPQQVGQQGMFHPGMQQGAQAQAAGMHHLPPPDYFRAVGGMSQNYGGGYGGGGPPPQALMERRAAAGVTGAPPGPGSGMMGPAPPGFAQGYNPGGAGNTMGGPPQQSGNMGMMSAAAAGMQNPGPQQYLANRPQYALGQGGAGGGGGHPGGPMVGSTGAGHLGGPGGGGPGPQGGAGAPPGGPIPGGGGYGGGAPGATPASAAGLMASSMHHQQFMALKQQQQQQQHQPPPPHQQQQQHQQTAALVAQLQRQLSGSGQVPTQQQQQPQGPPQQHSAYQHQGPY